MARWTRPAAGIPGVTVDIYEDSNNNGVIDDGDTLVNSTITDANGDYSFPGLPDGNYLVDVTDEDNVLDGYWHSDGTQRRGGQQQPDRSRIPSP